MPDLRHRPDLVTPAREPGGAGSGVTGVDGQTSGGVYVAVAVSEDGWAPRRGRQGEESITLMADLDAGATGTMPSALLPDLIRPVVEHHRAGRRAEAAARYARILPLINYENRQCGLRATKAVMAEGKVIRSEAVRHPLGPLPPASRAGLLELAREAQPLALRWGT
jgi:hypothetical protein